MNTIKNLNKLYFKSDYYSRHSGDVLSCILIIVIFITCFFYYNTSNSLKSVKSRWNIERCNPKYMPFAGYIMEPKNQSNLEYTFNNFFDCTNLLLKDVTVPNSKPMYSLLDNISKSNFNILNIFIKLISYIITLLSSSLFEFGKFEETLLKIKYPLTKISLALEDILGKVKGVLATGMYFVQGLVIIISNLGLIIYTSMVRIAVLMSIFLLFLILPPVFAAGVLATGGLYIPFIFAYFLLYLIVLGLVTSIQILLLNPLGITASNSPSPIPFPSKKKLNKMAQTIFVKPAKVVGKAFKKVRKVRKLGQKKTWKMKK